MLRVPFSGRGFFDGRRRSAESRPLWAMTAAKSTPSQKTRSGRVFSLRARVGRDDFCGGKSISRAKPERGAHGGARSSPFTSSLRPFFDKPREAFTQISAVFSNWGRALVFLTDWHSQKAAPRIFRGARRRSASAEAPPHREPPKLFRHILPGTKNSLLQNQPSWRIMSVTSNCTAKG